MLFNENFFLIIVIHRNDDQQTVYSACLSHASRDQMVAGSNELFNAKDKRREIEKKQELLQ